MKKTLTFSLLLALFFACSSGDDKTAASDSGSKPVAATDKKPDGEKIYKNYCITCHGLYGDMGGSGAFDLTTSKLTLEERIDVITNGRNLMTPFKGILSEEKIAAVAEYVETLRK